MLPNCSRIPGSIFAETIIPEDKRKEHIHVYLMIEYKNGLLVNSTQIHPISKLHNYKCYDYLDNSSIAGTFDIQDVVVTDNRSTGVVCFECIFIPGTTMSECTIQQ